MSGDIKHMEVERSFFVRSKMVKSPTQLQSVNQPSSAADFEEQSKSLDHVPQTLMFSSSKETKSTFECLINSVHNSNDSETLIPDQADQRGEFMHRSLEKRACIQEKQNKFILDFLNNMTLKGLQNLPTIGPKTAFILYCYRVVNGRFNSLLDLKNIHGLPLTFFARFCKANSVKVLDETEDTS